MEQVSSNKSFSGEIQKYRIESTKSLGGLESNVNVFLPEQAIEGDHKVPVLYYLAGLTCNEDTGAQKGGFLRDAAEQGIALVFPDTSPRGAGVEGEDKDWDFGTGAGFYLNATNDQYSKHYNMYDFIVEELPTLLSQTLPSLDLTRQSIFGHSMGGHGALTLYLKNLSRYRSCSAFAPIANPTKCPWGEKAFKGYLRNGVEEGKEYDANELLKKVEGKEELKILIDVGTGDNFYQQKQLLPENFISTRDSLNVSSEQIKVNLHEGYDHSYWFISTFGPSHIQYHAKILNALPANDGGKN